MKRILSLILISLACFLSCELDDSEDSGNPPEIIEAGLSRNGVSYETQFNVGEKVKYYIFIKDPDLDADRVHLEVYENVRIEDKEIPLPTQSAETDSYSITYTCIKSGTFAIYAQAIDQKGNKSRIFKTYFKVN